MDLLTVWFVLIGIFLVGYAVLDGFDLGVGILHLLARGEPERRALLRSIGPFWDGNEVWLVVFGGAMFAAFPSAYATAFTAFYVPFMLLLVALILRGVAIEFRHHAEGLGERRFWDVVFFAGSLVTTFCYGLVAGNSIYGLPLDSNGEFVGSLTDLVGPYPIMIGLFAVATFAMHGATYLRLRTTGRLRVRVDRWAWATFGLFLSLYLVVTVVTLWQVPGATDMFRLHPVAWVVPMLNVLAVANIPRTLHRGRPVAGFVSTSATIAAFTFLFGVALYPDLIVSSFGSAFHLTINRAASSPGTLRNLLIVVAIGTPFVLAYTAVTYWVFRGTVHVDDP